MRHSDNIFFHCSVPCETNPNPGIYSIPGKENHRRYPFFLTHFSFRGIYPGSTIGGVNGTPVFEQIRFPKIEMGDFRGVKLGLPPISLIDPYFQKVKRVLKKVY